jgi:hypothetical protein
MQKTYALNAPHKHRDRVLDAIKHDLRQRFKRARARPLAVGETWRFDCVLGPNAEQAQAVNSAELFSALNALAANGANEVFIGFTAHVAVRGTGPSPTAPQP